MRVALLNPRRQRRGGELRARRLAEALRRRGHEAIEIYLYPPEPGGGLAAGEHEICLDGREAEGMERLGWDPRTRRRLREALGDSRAEVVQVSGGKTLAYAALTTGRTRDLPQLIYRAIGEPGRWFRNRRHRWLYARWIYPRVGGVATVARRFVPALERACPNARAVRCIQGGIDLEELTRRSAPATVRAALAAGDDDPVVLYAGKLSPEKRVDRLLRAFANGLSRQPETWLWIAGCGPLGAALEHQAADLEIADRVRFLGVRDDVADLIHACDLVALSSDTEGVPGIAQEAAVLGRPVVATRAGGTEEAVVDGCTGLLVDVEDELGLSRALFDLITDPERRTAMGTEARQVFGGDRLSIKRVAEQYEELYREALAG